MASHAIQLPPFVISEMPIDRVALSCKDEVVKGSERKPPPCTTGVDPLAEMLHMKPPARYRARTSPGGLDRPVVPSWCYRPWHLLPSEDVLRRSGRCAKGSRTARQAGPAQSGDEGGGRLIASPSSTASRRGEIFRIRCL